MRSSNTIVGIFLLLAVSACAKREAPAPAIRPVQLAPVAVGAIADAAVFAGEVKARYEADLAFRIGGKIVERRVDIGAMVKKGQVLARLDPADVALQAQASAAAVAAARTESDFARAELDRYENLFRQKFVSESALDGKRNAMLAASARLQQAQANLAVNRNQADYATLAAPEDGVITSVNAEAGQVVASAQPVMKLARADEREVAIAVPESRIGEIKATQRIGVVLLANPAKPYAGRVREISPSVDPVTRTFSVRIAVPDADAALNLGMTANVVVMATGSEQGALVPSTSIYHTPDGKPAVWVYDTAERKVELRAVGLGRYHENGIVVTNGLRHGEWIVAAGVNKLQDGQAVKPYEAPGQARAAAAGVDGVVAIDAGRSPLIAMNDAFSESGTRPTFNLSEWALNHRSIVLYLIIVFALMGGLAYTQLGQSEDPPFTFKTMVVRTNWPGAATRDVEQQVTDRIERKLQELPIEWVRSYSKPGESLVFISFRDALPAKAIADLQYQARKKIGDMRNTLPQGIQGPFFNDEFGDTYTNIFAITGDGFGYRELDDFADRIRAELLRVPGVAKVDKIAAQDEKVFIELSNSKLATLGVEPAQILQSLAAQNAVAAAGAFETPTDRIHLRASGPFDSVDAIRDFTIRANDRIFRLGDIADVRRGYVDPPLQKMRWQGREALGLGITMAAGDDVIALGKALERSVGEIVEGLPVGVDIHAVADMPKAVQRTVNEFVRSLVEAVAIVLAVSLVSLGLRTGLVVAISIPLVLASTFLVMQVAGIGLHKISLGALILSLGLLVDDAIIAVEMMVIKMEQGFDRFRAASFAYASTAFPMLTGTLITVAGFLPIATAASSTGEYTRSLFQVSAIALIISWFVAVIVIPYLGYRLLPDFGKDRGASLAARLWARVRRKPPPDARHPHVDAEEVYDTPFYRRFRRIVDWCVAHRWIVIAATLAAFVGALALFRLVPQQFFPSSGRPELIVDLRLPEGSSFHATMAEAERMEAILAKETGIESYVGYVGAGSPRFYLPLDQQLPQANFAQFVLVAKSIVERERVRERLIRLFETDFPASRGRVTRLENGPPVGFPVQFRVSGDDVAKVRAIARDVRAVIDRDPDVANVQFDWDEPSKVIRLEVDQNKARVLGLSSQELAQFLNSAVSGITVTQFRERDELIDVVLRGAPSERVQLSFLRDLAIPSSNGKAVPISQIADIRYGLEDGIVWRRGRQPTVTVRADVRGNAQGPDVTQRISPQLDALRAGLPLGYRIEIGGAIEDSARGQKSIAAGVPLLLLSVLTLLMFQLRSLSRTAMVVLTAPLGLIGVALGLLAFRMPFGFVAMTGTIALSGIIMRNAVILVDQIERDIAGGETPWNAIVGATVRRFRPIVLTAAAAILAMIPLTRSDFFGPMAVAMMGGIFVATLLTLAFLPALYALWFRVRRPTSEWREDVVPA